MNRVIAPLSQFGAAFMGREGGRLPLAVALPETTEQVAAVLKYCHRYGVPVVPRGAGTSLSGGAIPQEDAVVVGQELAPEPEVGAEGDGTPKVLIVGYGRVGRLVGDMLHRHDIAWVAAERDAFTGGGMVALTVRGKRAVLPPSDELYVSTLPVWEPAEIRLIPYALWANRGEGEMRVYLDVR